MELQFWGAASTVTGSSHVLTVGDRRMLLDCGLFQGSRARAREINREFAVAPGLIDGVILSHAHIDHSGNLPQLVKLGFGGPIHCTSATADLTRVLLRDSGHIQEKDVEFINRKHKGKKVPPLEPLYTLEDAEMVGPMLKSAFYDQPVDILGGTVQARFRDVGHILGSAFVEITIPENGEKRLLFSGDVGRKNMPILRDPETPTEADYLILESTYGNRRHDEFATAEDKLAQTLRRVIERRGKIVIPAFSVGRTQEIVYALNTLWNSKRLPRVPVYVDSPLSVNVTEVFRHHPECYDDDVKRVFLYDPDPFGFEGLIYVRDAETSKSINRLNSPCIIISASGMCEAGRILHHLANTVSDPRNAILIVGYQAENTLGRRLVEKEPVVNILGEEHRVAAEIVTFNAFSAHADSEELRQFARAAGATGRLKKVFLVHGEKDALAALQQSLTADLPKCEIIVPERGQRFEL